MSAPFEILQQPDAPPTAPEASLKEQLAFERLLTDISAGFVNLPAAEIDSHIEYAQRRICETLGLDMSALWQWEEVVPGVFSLTHMYDPSGGPGSVERGIDAFYPWCRQQMISGRIVAISTLADLPVEAVRDRESARHIGVKSSLLLPLSVGGGQTIGILALNAQKQEPASIRPARDSGMTEAASIPGILMKGFAPGTDPAIAQQSPTTGDCVSGPALGGVFHLLMWKTEGGRQWRRPS